MNGKTTIPTKAWKTEYAALTAEENAQPAVCCPQRRGKGSRADPQERLQHLTAGTAGASAPQDAGYGVVK